MCVLGISPARCLTAYVCPWRNNTLTIFDVVTSLLLAVIGAYGLVFMYTDKLVQVLRREGNFAEADQLIDGLGQHVGFLLFCIALFGLTFFALFVWCFNMMRSSVFQAVITAQTQRQTDVLALLEQQLQKDFTGRVSTLLEQLPQPEFDAFYWSLERRSSQGGMLYCVQSSAA